MLSATDNFNTENLLKQGRSGDFFRGTLEGGTLVVIKRVNLRLVRKESFTSELELFSKVAHERLVPLMGHCLEDESVKFLVYKYMPNGDLSQALYRVRNGEECLKSLDWITRLKIAIGAAEALSYFHHESTPPVVHRYSLCLMQLVSLLKWLIKLKVLLAFEEIFKLAVSCSTTNMRCGLEV